MKRITYLVTEEQMEDIEMVLEGKTKKDFLNDLIVDFLALNISNGLEKLEIEVDKNVNKTISFEISDELHKLFKQFAKKISVSLKDLAYYISTTYLLETHYTDISELGIEIFEVDEDNEETNKAKEFYRNMGKSILENNIEGDVIPNVVPYLEEINLIFMINDIRFDLSSDYILEGNELFITNLKAIYEELVKLFGNEDISLYELITVIKYIYIIKNNFDF